MTPQDAIKWVDGKMLEIICELEVTKSEARRNRLNEEYQALTVLKSCAESRVPVKPTVVDEYLVNGHWEKEYECSACGNPRADDSFCSCCGQALDWR